MNHDIRDLLRHLVPIFLVGLALTFAGAGWFNAWSGPVRLSPMPAAKDMQRVVITVDGDDEVMSWPQSFADELALPMAEPSPFIATHSRFTTKVDVRRPDGTWVTLEQFDRRDVGLGVGIALILLLLRNAVWSGHPLDWRGRDVGLIRGQVRSGQVAPAAPSPSAPAAPPTRGRPPGRRSRGPRR